MLSIIFYTFLPAKLLFLGKTTKFLACFLYILSMFCKIFNFSFGSLTKKSYLCLQLTTTPAMIGIQEMMVIWLERRQPRRWDCRAELLSRVLWAQLRSSICYWSSFYRTVYFFNYCILLIEIMATRTIRVRTRINTTTRVRTTVRITRK